MIVADISAGQLRSKQLDCIASLINNIYVGNESTPWEHAILNTGMVKPEMCFHSPSEVPTCSPHMYLTSFGRSRWLIRIVWGL